MAKLGPHETRKRGLVRMRPAWSACISSALTPGTYILKIVFNEDHEDHRDQEGIQGHRPMELAALAELMRTSDADHMRTG
jgi:hypothetical protein